MEHNRIFKENPSNPNKDDFWDKRNKYRRSCKDLNRENKCQIQLQESPTGRLFHPMCNCNCLWMRKYEKLQNLKNSMA